MTHMRTHTQQLPGSHRTESILLIEHDLLYGFNLATAILQKTSYEVFIATERYQAQDFLRIITPALFLIEYQLPGMNGIELYDLLHAQKAFAHIPAIMFLSHDPRQQYEVSQRQIENLKKPFSPQELIVCIKRVVG